MNRRAFFGTMVGGVAASAALRTFPFRVYSFPTDIKIVSPLEFPEWMYSPIGYLYDPNSKQELAKFMGLVEKDKQGLIVSIRGDGARTNSPEVDDAYPDAWSDKLFTDEDLAKVNWA